MPSYVNPNKTFQETGKATPTPIAVAPLTTPVAPLNVAPPTLAPVPTITPTTPTAPVSTATEAPKSQFVSNLESLQAQLAGKTSDTAATKTSATAAYEGQLNNINSQLAAQEAKSLAHQEAALKSGETIGYASREAQNVQRTDAIETLKLQAIQAGIQGNIALAEKRAQSALDAKYGQLEQDIQTAKTNIYNNYDSFTPEEKKRANATLLRLDANDVFVKQQKEDEKSIYAMAISAQKNFPDDPEVQYAIQKALDSSDLRTAFSLIGKYQTDPIATKQAILNLEATRWNIEQSKAAKAASDRANQPYSGNPTDQLYTGLSSPTATAVRSKVTKFGSEPIVQNFATIQEGRNFASSLANATKNPADDQALIYALAKVLDPGSVVREGEYATAQKYAQSWISAYGKGVTQAIAGTGFLSQEARQNIKATIEQRYTASKRSYDNALSQYTKNINSLTGRSDGKDFLTDYSIPDVSSARGDQASNDFVASSLSRLGVSYQDALNNARPGEIAVLDNQTGQLGYITPAELNDNFTRL